MWDSCKKTVNEINKNLAYFMNTKESTNVQIPSDNAVNGKQDKPNTTLCSEKITITYETTKPLPLAQEMANNISQMVLEIEDIKNTRSPVRKLKHIGDDMFLSLLSGKTMVKDLRNPFISVNENFKEIHFTDEAKYSKDEINVDIQDNYSRQVTSTTTMPEVIPPCEDTVSHINKKVTTLNDRVLSVLPSKNTMNDIKENVKYFKNMAATALPSEQTVTDMKEKATDFKDNVKYLKDWTTSTLPNKESVIDMADKVKNMKSRVISAIPKPIKKKKNVISHSSGSPCASEFNPARDL